MSILKPGWPEQPPPQKPRRAFRSGTLEEQARRLGSRRGRTLKSLQQKLDRVLGKVEEET